jgi:hypothetical protein
MKPSVISLVFKELEKLHDCPDIVVLGDANNYPVGYYIPALIQSEEARYLMLLSTIDGEQDREFLQKAFLISTKYIILDTIALINVMNSGFYYNKNYMKIYKWTTDAAIKVLSDLAGPGDDNGYYRNMSEEELMKKKELRDSVPFNAIMPYHAGDVLFFAIASRNIKTHFTGIVINDTYLNIIVDNAPDMNPVPIDLPPQNRDGRNISEEEYFNEIICEIPHDSFYYYCRPTRLYNLSIFHLIDHFAFALGNSFLSKDELLINTSPSPKLYKPQLQSNSFKVLLQLGGGWQLKIYPEQFQNRLIDLLDSKGYEVTILADMEEKDREKCDSVKFESMSQFLGLLKSHHILIGMDSFPCHYTAHILGFPTICLFANTRPENSNAIQSEYYRFLENGLPCRPCSEVNVCPVNKKSYCENFVEPDRVVDEIITMLEDIYKANKK